MSAPARSLDAGPENLAIDVDGLTKVFNVRGLLPWRPRFRVEALTDVDLRVPAGSIQGIIGPNGSGKSTLLRILATLILPGSGKVRVGGVDVEQDSAGARRMIGFSTGEERSSYWRLTGRENLQFFASLQHLDTPARHIDATLEMLGLSDAADRPVMTYSQGMARRLGLARALIHQPRVLLLDEPARSLDPTAKEELHAILETARDERGTTIVIATHDLEEAVNLCDDVVILSRGRVVRDVVPSDPKKLGTELREATR